MRATIEAPERCALGQQAVGEAGRVDLPRREHQVEVMRGADGSRLRSTSGSV